MPSEFVDLNSPAAVDQLRANLKLVLDGFEPAEFESLVRELCAVPETTLMRPNDIIERYWSRVSRVELRQAMDIANAVIDSDLPNHST